MPNLRSKRVATLLGASLATGLLAGPALALQGSSATQVQLPEFQGMRSASAMGMLRTNAAGVQVLIRSAGPAAGMPGAWSEGRFSVATGVNPDFSQAALLEGLNRSLPSAMLASSLGFGGISTGGDVFPAIQSDGMFGPMPGGWVALSFQVGERDDTATNPYGMPGSSLRSVATSGRNAADAVISYYAEGNEGVASELVDAVVVEQTGDQMGVPATASSELSGLDFAMGTIASDPLGARAQLFAPVRDRFFFSLSKEWLEDAGNAPFVVAFQMVHGIDLDARTVYRMNWNDTASPLAWSAPEVEFSEAELFGAAGAPHIDKELDAISVFLAGPFERLIFSTTAESNSPDQVLGYDRWSMGPWSGAQPLQTMSGQLVSDQIGINKAPFQTTIDDVRGLCTWDPHETANPDGAVGTAIDHAGLGNYGPKLGLSVNRSRSSDKEVKVPKKPAAIPERMDLQVTGLDFEAAGGTVMYFADFGPLASSAQDMLLEVQDVSAGSLTASFSYPVGPVPLAPATAALDLHVIVLAIPNDKPKNIRSSWTTVIAP